MHSITLFFHFVNDNILTDLFVKKIRLLGCLRSNENKLLFTKLYTNRLVQINVVIAMKRRKNIVGLSQNIYKRCQETFRVLVRRHLLFYSDDNIMIGNFKNIFINNNN